MKTKTFMDRALDFEFVNRDIDEALNDEISEWHTAQQRDVGLHIWLGMTWKEYAQWCQTPELLQGILYARKAK